MNDSLYLKPADDPLWHLVESVERIQLDDFLTTDRYRFVCGKLSVVVSEPALARDPVGAICLRCEPLDSRELG